MPVVEFDSLPDSARVWVFGADRALVGPSAQRLLAETDAFLRDWKAHGQPLTVARDWRDQHFLVVAVDQRDEHASGCSIDGLFRALQRLQGELGAQIVGGGRVFYRGLDGHVQAIPRDEIRARHRAGELGTESAVFDTSVTTMDDYRSRFEQPARVSWLRELL